MERLDPNWPLGPSEVTLRSDDLHVWSFDLRASGQQVETFRNLLTPDEIARADRFKFPRHQRRFTVARGILRTLLGHYLEVDASSVDFLTTKYGKPFVRHALRGHELSFNLTHSHEFALCALTLQRRIGVDLEHMRRIVDLESIAQHFFAPAEVDVLLSTPKHERQQVFLNCWTRKEAYIKAIGQGLSHPLNTFLVSMRVGDSAELLADESDPSAPDRWHFTALKPHGDYVAAVAVEQESGSPSHRFCNLSCWHWSGHFQA